MDLSGRKALVTGGAGHIGAAVTEALVELGASVGIVDLSKSESDKRVESLSRLRSGCAVSIPCQLDDEQATRAAVRQMIAQYGGLDIFVHCAAYVGATDRPGWAVPFEQQTVDAWDAAMRVNLTSAFVVVQEARQALAASGCGSVILFASIYGIVGPDMRLYDGTSMANPVGYGASKGGLLHLMRYLATLLAYVTGHNLVVDGGWTAW
jgi:NAD(P)-dependent dehydrogenase (short-subunit alcohol dehydrogenase family)